MDNNFKNVHLIEPLKEKFEDLKRNYSNSKSDIVYHNFAIYKNNGEESFYLSGTESSFLRHTDNQSIKVKTKTIQNFILENNLMNIDLLFLDVEGVEDTIIVNLLEKTNIRPKMIRYEFPHLKKEEELIKTLEQHGYKVFNCCYAAGDRVCIKNGE